MKRRTVPAWIAAALALLNVLLAVMFWSVKRRRNPRLHGTSQDPIGELLRSIAGITQTTLTEGNGIELVENGRFFDRLHEDLEQARETIHLETFLTKQGEVTRKLTDILCRRAGEGVRVRLLLDGTGGRHYGDADLERLRDAGVEVCRFHPIRPANLGLWNARDHRKLVVIDGRIGYVGGHCLTDFWLGDAEDRHHYRDISARVQGPVVAQMQAAFCENWIEETGDVPAGAEHFPELGPAGDVKAHLVWASPIGMPSAVKLLYWTAISAARERITIQNPYFLPDPDAREALAAAVGRGVEVRVMIPATHVSDASYVQHASHHHYGTLLEAGVELYDYNRTLLHQKVMVVDGSWSIVGSANFDDRSLEVNDEVVLAMYSRDVAGQLEAIFERDREESTRMDLESWKARPWKHKLLDFTTFLFNEQM